MKILIILIICFILTSCAKVYDTKMSHAQDERIRWEEKAKKGEPEAQFRLGNAYCCGKNGFFDTQEAIKWWCKASQQGHLGAKKALIAHSKKNLC